jgi:hypothetical protein
VTADGCTIPRHGYRHEDFVDDYLDADANTSAEGFCITTVQRTLDEVREPATVYRLKRAASVTQRVCQTPGCDWHATPDCDER